MVNITRFNPLDDAFDNLFRGVPVWLPNLERREAAPAQFRMDVSENDRQYQVLAEMPGLKKEDIRHFVLHSAGRRVIEEARRLLDLDDTQVAHSRHVLRHFGNMSSATVLFVLEEALRSGGPVTGDWGLMIALGPGFAAEGALLRW